MGEIWSYVGSLYNREGYEITQTVWRWVALIFLPVVILYVGTAVHAGRKKGRLEREAYTALNNGQYRDALQKFSEASWAARSVLVLHTPQFRNTTDESVADAFFRLGDYPAAVYFYTRCLYRHFGEEFAHISAPPPGLPMPIPVTSLYAKLGIALLRSHCYEEAMVWLRRAAAAGYAGNSEVWLALSEAYERTGNSQMAAECRQHAAALSGEETNGLHD